MSEIVDDRWPEILSRRVQPDGALRLSAQGLIPGQLTPLISFGLLALASLFATCFSPRERVAGVCMLLISALLLWWFGSDLLAWTRLTRIHDGWRIETGVWRWRLRSVTIADATIDCALTVVDDRRYQIMAPRYEHVRVVFVAKPFNAAPPALEIAEMYRIPRAELEALASVLGRGATGAF